jgi:alpha-L-rhamnosidase
MTTTKIIAAAALSALAGALLTTAGTQPAVAEDQQPGQHASDAPGGLTVDDQAAPLNVEDVPQFAWLPRDLDADEVQSAYQVKVMDADRQVWDSGKVASSEQSYVEYAGPELDPGAAYTWTVRTWDRTDRESPWARPGTFETGLGDQDWDGAQWIRRDTTEIDDYTLARKVVSIPEGRVLRARAYTAANHTFELFLDGRRADRGSSFGYPGEGYYQAADVTRLVRPGDDLAIGLRYFWYGGGQGRAASERGVLHKLVVEYDDGRRAVFTTDGSWTVHRDTRFVAGAGRRNGEGDRIDQQDARGVIAGWDRPRFDDSGWAPATVVGTHPTPTLSHLIGAETRVAEREVTAERLLRADDGTVVADFGRVIPARPEVDFDEGVAGRAVPLRAGYELSATGRVATSTLATQGTNMSFPYIQAAGPQTYEAFTHLAFRYLEIPGADEEIALEDVRATLVHAEMPERREATFRSSDRTLNQVWDLMQRSALYSIQEQFVDTPTREKGQFLGDAANISYATMQGFAERDATQQAIREFLQSNARHWRTGADAGRYNAVYPNGDGKRDIPDYTEMFVDWVWRYYEVTGDEAMLELAYPAVRQTADYVLRHIPTEGPTAGLVTNLTGGSGGYRYGIVDWPEPGRFGYDMTAAARTTVNALGVEVLRRTADMAEVLGESESDVDMLRTAEQSLVTTMNERLRRPDGVYVDGLLSDGTQSGHAGQHSTSYAIAFGIAPESDHPALAEHIAGMGMRQGPMTAHWALQALSDAGRPDAVLEMLTDETDLGWANILAHGATFTWEAWTLDPGTNFSQSHGWGAQAAVDVIESQLGIRLGEPGGATVRIQPPASGLARAEGSVPTQRGEVALAWQRSPGGIGVTVEVPVNVTVTVALPAVPGWTYETVGGHPAEEVGRADGLVLLETGSGTTRIVPVRTE